MNVTEFINDNLTVYNYSNDNNTDDNFMTIGISPIFLLIAIITPCAFSIICCLSFLSYSFVKVLINKK